MKLIEWILSGILLVFFALFVMIGVAMMKMERERGECARTQTWEGLGFAGTYCAEWNADNETE